MRLWCQLHVSKDQRVNEALLVGRWLLRQIFWSMLRWLLWLLLGRMLLAQSCLCTQMMWWVLGWLLLVQK